MTTDTWATFGRIVVWSMVLSMNLLGWVFPLYAPQVVVQIDTLAFPAYVEQLGKLAQSPVADYGHRFMGGLLLVLGAVQFNRGLRQRYPHLHRLSGYCYIMLGGIVAIFGVFLAIRHGFAGFTEQAFIFATAMAYLAILIRALRYALVQNFSRHREWMIRGYALVLFIAVQRDLMGVMYLSGLFPASPQEIFNTTLIFSVAGNLAVGEWWIYRTRPCGSEASASVPVAT